MARRRGPGQDHGTLRLPARRAACRPAAYELGEPVRMYVAGREPDGTMVVDVVDGEGALTYQWRFGRDEALALTFALLADATGHPARATTAAAFTSEVLDRLPADGFAISSGEICAWLLLRAIERASNG
jgi:hypothetical protein